MQSNELPPVTTRYLTRADAAHYIRTTYGFPCSRQWLAKLAVLGGGPVFRKAGRTPLYVPADLDAWALSRIGGPQRSTADISMARGTLHSQEPNDDSDRCRHAPQ